MRLSALRRAARVLAVSVAALAAGSAGAARAKDRALVVGIDHYPGILVGGVGGQKDLGGAVFDARTFVGLLDTQFGVHPDEIHVLLDADASRQRILDEFTAWLIEGTGPGDRVFFYFAGHGAAVRVEDEAAGTGRMTSALVPADAHGELTAQPLAVEGMILGVEMHRLLDRLAGRDVTVMADSCQSGSVSRDISHPFRVPPGVRVRTLTPAGAVGMSEAAFQSDAPLRRAAKLNGRLLEIEAAAVEAPSGAAASGSAAVSGSLAVWSAATTDQVTFDLPDRPGGVFTQSFADGLRDRRAPADAQGRISAAALLNYVRDQARSFCAAAGPACSAGLTPQLLAASPYLLAALAATPEGAPPAGGGQATATALSTLLQHRNDFPLEVRLLPGPDLRIGQAIEIRVASGEDGKVAVFDLTPDGDLTQLFPNGRTDRTGRIKAGAPLTIPDAYWGISLKAVAPAGAGALFVVVTEPGLDLARATGLNLGFRPVAQTSRLLQVIAEAVDHPVVSPTLEVPTRAPRWAFVRLPYAVTP